VLVLLLDPFALLSAGFWLSFIAVGVIFYAMLSRLSQTGWWWKWGYAQWVVTIGLMPVLIALFGQVPLISPLANLFAIPWVSFVVTPLALVGTILLFIVPFLGKWILVAGAYTMEVCWWPLEWLAQWDALLWRQHQPLTWTIPLAGLGAVWMLLPKGWPARWLGGVLCLPMLLIKPEGPGYGDAWVTFLDVGQGLAAVVRTQDHVLVYDTGPRLSDYFDTGEAVVVPFLRSQGILSIDTLIVSHGDIDHRGGVNSIFEAMPVAKLMASIEQPLPRTPDVPCIAQPLWQQDGVWMEILHPRADSRGKGNNLACVLRVATNRQSVLLTADIEKQAERQLVEYYGDQLRSDVLLVPHHGSKTSSTEQFLEAVQPAIAVAATGYYNRYRFPKAEVVERYFRHGISFYNTALTGAFTVKLSGQAPLTVEEYALESRRFWHRHDTFDSGVKDEAHVGSN
jgi:competence protein ComEC